ncbi:50S ribosomal protein L11 [Candidatus Woesearchaeota archaeon]|nr:50S ribosomal protein L11 [Candidatus Woesearchaeota archaeon]
MAKETIEALVEGGKATAGPPIGPALGPLKVNIGEVVKAINDKTKDFQKMQVPVKVIIDTDTKEFEIQVGTPPASQLILKEAMIEKGAGNPLLDKVADLKIEQIIKIAKMKEDSLSGKDMKNKVREIVGTCQSMGILVEGVPAREALQQIHEGKFDQKIQEERTELSEEDKKKLEAERAKLQEATADRMKKLEAKAKEIIAQNKSKEASKIKGMLLEAKIPPKLVDKVMTEAGIVVESKAAAPAAGAAKPAAGKAPAKKK